MSGKAEKKKQNFHDPDSDLMETDLSLTFQGDFCVSMTGRAALRSKKTAESKRRAARAAQKKTSAAQRHAKWTREKEHTSTANTSDEGAYSTVDMELPKWNKVVTNSQNLRPKAKQKRTA